MAGKVIRAPLSMDAGGKERPRNNGEVAVRIYLRDERGNQAGKTTFERFGAGGGRWVLPTKYMREAWKMMCAFLRHHCHH